MKIYAIADLHLAISTPDKRMDVFGGRWEKYMEKIAQTWRATCNDNDVIIIAGDISWAMSLENIKEDFAFLDELPGRKVCFKGNHDYWWTTLTKLERYKVENELEDIFFIHNNCYVAGDTAICGSRGWILPEDKKFSKEDIKIYERELARLRLSLEDAKKMNTKQIVVAFHYPPFSMIDGEVRASIFIDMLKEYGVEKCVFGHIHATDRQFDIWCEAAAKASLEMGMDISLVSADYLNFKPVLLVDDNEL